MEHKVKTNCLSRTFGWNWEMTQGWEISEVERARARAFHHHHCTHNFNQEDTVLLTVLDSSGSDNNGPL